MLTARSVAIGPGALPRGLVAAWVVIGAGASPASAQNDAQWTTHAWVGEVTFLSANALLAGLTAGLTRELRGGAFRDGFAAGALGGAVAYGGRRIAVEEFDGAGLVGRQVSAVGASIARNAGDGVPALAHIRLPVGPITVHVQRHAGLQVNARVNLYSTAWLLAALADERLDFDTEASLSAGAPVFRTPGYSLRGENGALLGSAVGGVVVLSDEGVHPIDHNVLAHERVHVLQQDFAQILWGDPLEGWIGRHIPGGPTILRYAQPGVIYPAIQTMLTQAFSLRWGDRPWEIEAEFLEHR